MSSGVRRPHQVRTYLGTELYERVLREAAVQRCSVSECIHDALQELYAIRDELNRPLDLGKRKGSKAGPLAHRLMAQLEERMTGGLSRQLDEIHSLAERLRRLEAMADRQYVSLMLYLPDVGEDEAEDRSARANRRYQAWRRAVEKTLDSSKRRR